MQGFAAPPRPAYKLCRRMPRLRAPAPRARRSCRRAGRCWCACRSSTAWPRAPPAAAGTAWPRGRRCRWPRHWRSSSPTSAGGRAAQASMRCAPRAPRGCATSGGRRPARRAPLSMAAGRGLQCAAQAARVETQVELGRRGAWQAPDICAGMQMPRYHGHYSACEAATRM